MGAVIRSITGCCSTRHATDNFIPPWARRVCRTPSHGCSERLEPDIGKLICPVLRGGGGGNVVPLLDTMRLTVLDQYGKGLVHCDQVLGEEIRQKIERLKWSLWHGNLFKALYKIDDIESLIYNFEKSYPKFKQLLKAVEEFRTYITNNGHLIPNYGERYRNGEAIATGFVESTVNQVVSKRFCKKQQMQWSKRGAHLLLQTRVKTLNRELGSVFKQWYPDMEVEEVPDAA
jgi:hypothetical protein